MLVFLIIIICIAILGHYGFPEKIDENDYQQEPDEESLLRGAGSFILNGNSKTGFLLVHGYEGSPFTLRSLGEALNNQGHTVIAPLLPGHGTNRKLFKKTRYEHWYRCVERNYLKEFEKFEKFFIIAFSMGGNLALNLVTRLNREKQPAGLVLISTPVFLNAFANGKLIVKDFRLFFSGIIKYLVPFIPKKKGLISADVMNPWIGYADFHTTACVHSFKKNISKPRKRLKFIQSPVCMLQANNDRTIDSENLYYILKNLGSEEKRAFLFTIKENESTRHVLMTHEHTRQKVFHYIFKFIEDTQKKFDLTVEKGKKPIFKRKGPQ